MASIASGDDGLPKRKGHKPSSSYSSANSPSKAVDREVDEISYVLDGAASRELCAFSSQEELRDIASRNVQGIYASPVREGDILLNPANPAFDVYEWAKMTLCALDKANVKVRRVSYAFKNLNVSGLGSTINYQATVASVFMIPHQLRGYITGGKKPQMKILSDFEGVVKSGEMLLVLGRPGSGCSTFLRTMAGELHGLTIDEASVVKYSGIIFHSSCVHFMQLIRKRHTSK